MPAIGMIRHAPGVAEDNQLSQASHGLIPEVQMASWPESLLNRCQHADLVLRKLILGDHGDRNLRRVFDRIEILCTLDS